MRRGISSAFVCLIKFNAFRSYATCRFDVQSPVETIIPPFGRWQVLPLRLLPINPLSMTTNLGLHKDCHRTFNEGCLTTLLFLLFLVLRGVFSSHAIHQREVEDSNLRDPMGLPAFKASTFNRSDNFPNGWGTIAVTHCYNLYRPLSVN